MHHALLALCLLASPAVYGQDSSRTAPKWVCEFLIGGGDGEHVNVRLGPEETGEIDIAGWFHLGLAVERRVVGGFAWRGYIGYESGGWQSNTPANPFAAPNSTTDRWTMGVFGVHHLHRGRHSQYSLYAGARAVIGMNIGTEYRTDTAWVSSSFQHVDLHYGPALIPQAGATWRWQFREKPEGLMLRAGVEYATYTYQEADLSAGLSELPTDLDPLTGTHSGWAYTIEFGLYVMP